MRAISILTFFVGFFINGSVQALESSYRIVSSYKITDNVERFNLPDGNTIGTMFCTAEPATAQIMIVDSRVPDGALGVNYSLASYEACLKTKIDVKFKLLNKKCVVYLVTDTQTKAAKFLVSKCK
ncbi:MAG: hypothetical protein H7061_08725 [Bdellovibrionaceae bacterium]|nr:hypothetical protein [Bdellovibrio sp.]